MRRIALTAMVFSLWTAAAIAAAANQGPQNPPIKAPMTNNASAPVAGANSFTRGQAIRRIQAKGYTLVKGLQKDANGIWRGTAMKNGKSGPVSLDYQGNVN